MHKSLIQLLVKYGMLEIIPMQEGFFKLSTLTKNVKLSPELLQLNYAKLSPIANPAIVSYKEENSVYLWFFQKHRLHSTFCIPESFLLYRSLRDEGDGVFVFDTTPKQVYVLKEKRLQAAFLVHGKYESANIALMQDEYDLEKVLHFDANEYSRRLEQALENLSVYDFSHFMQVKLDREYVKRFFIEKLTYPIVSLLGVYMLVSYLQGYFMEQKEQALMQEYQTLKTKNTDLKNSIRLHNKEVKQLEDFFRAEFVPVEPFTVVYDLYKVITPKDKAIVTFLSVNNNNIKIKIQTNDSAIKYLKRFNAINYLKDVVIDNTFKHRSGYKIHTFSMKIKGDDA